MPALDFTFEPLSVIIPAVQVRLAEFGEAVLCVPDPDLGTGLYSGESTAHGLYRPLAVWLDLADALETHFLVPEKLSGGKIKLRLQVYQAAPDPSAGGYAPAGAWGRVNKGEDAAFWLTLTEAFRRVNPPDRGRVLALGVNSGRELDLLADSFPQRSFEIVGVDLDAEALAVAKNRYPTEQFVVLDINALPAELGKFDLVLALSVLQSPGVVQDRVLATVRKNHLTAGGGLILGFPNARYRDGFLSYGARMRNFARPDFSLLMADVTDARRRLQKYGFKVFVTGKYEVLVTAIPASQPTPKDNAVKF